ncbi:MAG TPA: hypothetical protein VIJ31_12085 [Acidothermaceae bacterium]
MTAALAERTATTEPAWGCTVLRDEETRCGAFVIAQMVAACVHEHVVAEEMCSYDLYLAKRGELMCSACWLGDGHKCSQTYRVAP